MTDENSRDKDRTEENSQDKTEENRRYEARQERLELLNDEVLSLDPGSMTEEEARQTGIWILSTYVETTRSYARASLGCNLLMVLVFTLLFQDAPVSSDDDYDSYRAAAKLLKQFQKGTYKKGYVAYLTDFQNRIKDQRERKARLEQQAEAHRQQKEARRQQKEQRLQARRQQKEASRAARKN